MPLTSIRNTADAANVALVRVGWKGGDIGDLREGSPAADVVLDVFGQVRDSLLRDGDWDFAQRTDSLALLKQAPAGGYVPGFTSWDPNLYPPLGWLFEYGYPSLCIKVRAVKPVQIFAGPNFDPSYNRFSIANDAYFTPAQEVILCNVENAACIYTARVTDPTTWPASFAEAFVDSLAETIAPTLANLDTAKLAAAKGQQSDADAQMEQG